MLKKHKLKEGKQGKQNTTMGEDEQETSSVASALSVAQTKSPISLPLLPPDSAPQDKTSQGDGNKAMEFGKEERKFNHGNNANSGKKRRKRKHRSKSEDEREIFELQKERYDRLIYTARKHLHKAAKQVKTFLLQKEIRKQSNKSNEKASQKNSTDTTVLNTKKSLDLDVVTSQAIRQLGLYHCDPRFKMATEETAAESGPPEDDELKAEETKPHNGEGGKSTKSWDPKKDIAIPVIPAPLAPDDPQKPLVDAVLAHKRFSKCLEEWNEKVTEYRRWCMKLEQRNNPNPFGADDDFGPSKRSKKRKNKDMKRKGAASDAGLQATVENESSLFCTLGSGFPDSIDRLDEFNKYSQYGPASDLAEVPKRKNRKGQRQRRAKALAIEAKKQGRSHEHYQSANWRERKPIEGNDDSNRDDGSRRKSRGRGREKNRNQRSKQQQNQEYELSSSNEHRQQERNPPEEQQHPSWAAKQAQSTGIVAFKGTKITF